jgi:mannose-6-phosphate isomerase-like protein (cupin superfamily)
MHKPVSKKEAEQYTWGKHCKSMVLHISENLSVKEEMMPAGASEQLHYHMAATQFFFVLKGVAIFYVAGKRIEVKEQEGLTIEKMEKHTVVNESNGTITFLVVSQPDTAGDRVNV